MCFFELEVFGDELLGRLAELEVGLDARDELVAVEGFCEIIDCAEGEAADALGCLAEGGHEDDRDVGRGGICLQAAADLETVELRHQRVEQDEVRRPCFGLREDALAVHGHGDCETLPGQDVREHPQIGGFVVDDEHQGRRGGFHASSLNWRRSVWDVKRAGVRLRAKGEPPRHRHHGNRIFARRR